MMKKYNKPEIVTLALDTVDVIETSGTREAMAELDKEGFQADAAARVEEQIKSLDQQWHW